MVAQLERAERNLFDSAADIAKLDVFAFPEGVVEQEEAAGKDVADHGLRTKADGQADNAGAGKERRYVHAEI